MLINSKPELASCITGCLQIAQDVFVELSNVPIIKDNEKCKPERYDVSDSFRKLRMKMMRSMNKEQIEVFNQINAEISDSLQNEIKVLLGMYKTELATKVKYNYLEVISLYICVNEFVYLSQLYYIKFFGRQNRFIEEIQTNIQKFGERVEDVNLNPETKIEIKNVKIEEYYSVIIEKIVNESLK